jgi:hypothetical protein
MRLALEPAVYRLDALGLPRSLLFAPVGLGLLALSLALALWAATRGAPLTALALVAWGILAYGASVGVRWRVKARAVPVHPDPPPPVTADSSDAGLSTRAEIDEQAARQFEDLVEDALRNLNKPASLVRCGLIDRIPRTLGEARGQAESIGGGAATGLDRARLLRGVLVAAVERLKPAEGDATSQALQYHVVREEYVLGRSILPIALRHSVSEQTVYRRRREAIELLAREIREHEASLAQGRPTSNREAMDYLG